MRNATPLRQVGPRPSGDPTPAGRYSGRESGSERCGTAVRWVANRDKTRQGAGSMDANGHDERRLENCDEPHEERSSGRELNRNAAPA